IRSHPLTWRTTEATRPLSWKACSGSRIVRRVASRLGGGAGGRAFLGYGGGVGGSRGGWLGGVLPKWRFSSPAVRQQVPLLIVGAQMKWTDWMQKANARDQKTSYYWESAVQHELGCPLPKVLRPGEENAWPRYTGEAHRLQRIDAGYSDVPAQTENGI